MAKKIRVVTRVPQSIQSTLHDTLGIIVSAKLPRHLFSDSYSCLSLPNPDMYFLLPQHRPVSTGELKIVTAMHTFGSCIAV